MAVKRIEYMCSHCGKKETRFVSMGKPQPGKCPRRQGDKPHVWTINHVGSLMEADKNVR